jgi:hypothetical protein
MPNAHGGSGSAVDKTDTLLVTYADTLLVTYAVTLYSHHMR